MIAGLVFLFLNGKPNPSKPSTKPHPSPVSDNNVALKSNSIALPADPALQKIITKNLKLHRRFLEKCFIKFFDQETDHHKQGQVVTKFKVTKKGRLKEIAITKSDFDNENLHLCVTEVLSRVHFKNYKGTVKEIEFPIELKLP